MDADLGDLGHKTSSDFKNVIRLYIKQILLSTDSTFVKTEGLKGLRALLREAEQRREEQKNKKD